MKFISYIAKALFHLELINKNFKFAVLMWKLFDFTQLFKNDNLLLRRIR